MDRLIRHAQALAAAIQFLTRIPVPLLIPFERPVLSRSVIYFPLAGALIGLLLWLASELLVSLLPPWPSAIILVGLGVMLTGGLHLDGWMDTADGVFSHRSRERMLEIMKDSRVGAMGVIAAVLLLLLKISVVAELLALLGQHEVSIGWLFILACSWSRAWMAAAIGGWPTARGEEGLAALFNGVNSWGASWALLLAGLVSFAALQAASLQSAALPTQTVIGALLIVAGAGIVSALCGASMAIWLTRKLGGLTGDTYGAMNEAIEACVLLAALMWLYNG
ncbi:adenosylcobinamide-GDP ribazoletransferase [Paenibacillus sp. PL2-23]|uniref:adenosylcobinamide-GDP ribazoletransferase n=1 Tax=Paenibacillus sp. PL2-23 TaxID=2100729 RepID=UPI0030FC610F